MNRQMGLGIFISSLLHVAFIAWLIVDIRQKADDNSGMEAEMADLSQSVMLTLDMPLGKLKEVSTDKQKSQPSINSKKTNTKMAKKQVEIKTKENNIQSDIEIPRVEEYKEENDTNKSEEAKENTQDSKNAKMLNDEDSKQKDKTASAPIEGSTDKATTQVSGASAKQISSYQGLIKAHLNKFKQYPNQALANKDEGVVVVRIRLNEHGEVIEKSIRKPCNSNILNNEVINLIARANPLPAPPKEMLKNNQIVFNLPIKYNIKEYYKHR